MDALYNAAKPRVVAIGGPTATGKTALSVALAKRFGGEIISADSMQIYQGLDVGTAKVTPEEMQGVPHHLVGFLAPEQAFSVADFTTLAGKTITQLTAQGKLPLVVGGTGLYITSLLNGIGFTPEKVDPAIRQELQARLQAEGSGEDVYQLASDLFASKGKADKPPASEYTELLAAVDKPDEKFATAFKGNDLAAWSVVQGPAKLLL